MSETSKRVVRYHISRLKDKNPQSRLNAINELRVLGDIEAMEALENLFRNDPDEEVRRAARDAGRELWQKNN